MFTKNSITNKIKSYSLHLIALLLLILLVTTIKASASADATKSNSAVKVEKNGVSVSINKITTNKKGKTDIVSCFDYPDNDDWLPHVKLNDDTETISLEEGILINPVDPATSASNHRCYHLIFSKELVRGKKVKLVVDKIQTTIPESLTQDMCLDAQKKIQVDYPDFAFSCDIGDHGIGYTITSLPSEMDENQAYGLINDALTKKVDGPWELDVTIP